MPKPRQIDGPLDWPEIRCSPNVQVQTILEDQIVVLTNFFSPKTCASFVKFCSSLPLVACPPAKRGEAVRLQTRYSVVDPAFAASLCDALIPHVDCLFAPDSALVCHSNIRVYRYEKGQYFGRHFDDHSVDPTTHRTSHWTLLIYLTGDDVSGGETVFYLPAKRGQTQQEIVPPLLTGMCLLHRHGQACLEHEGRMVKAGVKWVLRSDICL